MSNTSCSPPSDLVVVLLERDDRLLYEAHVIDEAARAKGFSSMVLGPGLQEPALLEKVREHRPLLVLVGVCPESAPQSQSTAHLLLRRAERPVLLFGRGLALASERQLVTPGSITGVIVGEAAPTVIRVLLALRRGKIEPTPGLDLLDGSFRPRPPRHASETPPSPRFSGADLFRLQRIGLPIRLSQGCPRRCTFCGDQMREGAFRSRRADEVFAEMALQYRSHGVRRFHFCDLVINGDLGELERLCDLLLEEKLEVLWWGRVLVDPRMTRALFRKMRLAGCIDLELEVISGSDKILAAVSAEFTSDQASRSLRRAHAAGIHTRASLSVGLPQEEELEFAETAAWLHANRLALDQVKDLLPFMLQPGSAMVIYPALHGLHLAVEDPWQNWHNGGFNNSGYRLKRTREMRVFVEDGLQLEVTGRTVEVPWAPELRARIGERLLMAARQASVLTGRFRQENRALAGAFLSSAPLAGPTLLEIDLTNACNLHCAGCWTHSLLLGEDHLSGEKRKANLPIAQVTQVIAEAKKLGTKRIQLSGAGEPFMHPDIEEIIRKIKEEDLHLEIITNFTLVDEARARQLVDLGVDAVTISLWAGTAETYLRTHPTAPEEMFERLTQTVRTLTDYRRRTGATRPRVKIYNVISTLNCGEIHAMIDAARDMGADLIELTPIDLIAGKTDGLALSPADRDRLLEQLMSLRDRPDYLQRTPDERNEGRVSVLEEQSEFARFVQRQLLAEDFRFSLKDILHWESYCRRGIHCRSVRENIYRENALVFTHPAGDCQSCLAHLDCSIDPITYSVKVPFLSLQGLGSFWRRVAQSPEEKRDAAIVDRVPCSIGYTYARIQATGHVIPCCKAADFPLGTIKETSFSEIWSSAAYDEFRRKALSLPKSDPYFSPMSCYKVCDNLGHNLQTQQALEALTPTEKEALGKG